LAPVLSTYPKGTEG